MEDKVGEWAGAVVGDAHVCQLGNDVKTHMVCGKVSLWVSCG